MDFDDKNGSTNDGFVDIDDKITENGGIKDVFLLGVFDENGVYFRDVGDES